MSSFRIGHVCLGGLALSLLLGCEGSLGGSSRTEPGGSGGTSGVPDEEEPLTPEQCALAPIDPGPSPIRRLTRAEYDNTLHDLLGDTTGPGSAFPDEEIGGGFNNNANAQAVSVLLIEAYEKAATDLAASAIADLPKLLGCDPATTGEDACMQSFVPAFGRNAYRHTLPTEEVERLLGFYSTNKAAYDFPSAVRMTLEAMLQSPYFLYRVEALGTESVSQLSGEEIASRISYLLWASMPDKDLFDAAQSGALATAEGIKTQAERLFDDPRAEQGVSSFFAQWLDLERLSKVEKDATIFPTFTTDVRALLRTESDLFVHDVAFGGGTLETLLLGNYTFMNAGLAAFYGVTGPAGDAFEKVTLDGSTRLGILTQGSFLASNANVNETSPILRGLFIRDRLLCDPPDPPPPNIPPLPPVDPSLSTRERLAQHRSEAVCATCHDKMDPVGYGFEHFDGAGAWREMDGGKAVDATGEILGGSDVDGPFNGAIELATKLSQSDQARACVAKHWFRYGSGRTEDDADQCTLQELTTSLKAGNFRSLMIGLTQTDAFRYRTNQLGESQ